MARVKVDIKFNPVTGTMYAHDQATGKPLPNYSNLTYGDTAASRNASGDDPVEAIKTLTAGAVKQTKTDAVCVGWADVPD